MHGAQRVLVPVNWVSILIAECPDDTANGPSKTPKCCCRWVHDATYERKGQKCGKPLRCVPVDALVAEINKSPTVPTATRVEPLPTTAPTTAKTTGK